MTRSRLLLAVSLTLLAARALAAEAPAATPAVLDAALNELPKQVIGVTGSGDKLTLQLTSPTGPRLLKTGDVYADGWRLTGLTDAAASLTKDQQTVVVGLGPDGTAPSTQRTGLAAMLARNRALNGPGGAGRALADALAMPNITDYISVNLTAAAQGQPMPGLTLDETRQYLGDMVAAAQNMPNTAAMGNVPYRLQIEARAADENFVSLEQKLQDATDANRLAGTPELNANAIRDGMAPAVPLPGLDGPPIAGTPIQVQSVQGGTGP